MLTYTHMFTGRQTPRQAAAGSRARVGGRCDLPLSRSAQLDAARAHRRLSLEFGERPHCARRDDAGAARADVHAFIRTHVSVFMSILMFEHAHVNKCLRENTYKYTYKYSISTV